MPKRIGKPAPLDALEPDSVRRTRGLVAISFAAQKVIADKKQ